MAGKVASKAGEAIVIDRLLMGEVHVGLIGTTPLVYNRMSQKVRQGLLNPEGPGIKRTSTAERKAAGPKHNPLMEYQASVHQTMTLEDPTLFALPTSAVKRSMASAALDIPGTRKAQIGRLVWVPGEYLPLFGTAQLKMDVVRMSDPGRTPDIRTRAVVRSWCVVVVVKFVEPLLDQKGIVNLLAAAGQIIGLGDGRQEKGALDFGQFEVVSLDDPRMEKIIKAGGRQAQIDSLADPVFYDDESRDLFDWWTSSMGKPAATEKAPALVSANGAK